MSCCVYPMVVLIKLPVYIVRIDMKLNDSSISRTEQAVAQKTSSVRRSCLHDMLASYDVFLLNKGLQGTRHSHQLITSKLIFSSSQYILHSYSLISLSLLIPRNTHGIHDGEYKLFSGLDPIRLSSLPESLDFFDS